MKSGPESSTKISLMMLYIFEVHALPVVVK